jgi:hypothetical protein
MTDVGGFYLGFGVLFAWAARTLERTLVRAACVAFTLTQSLHFLFHLAHLDRFTVAQAAAQTIALGGLLALPIAVLALTGRHPGGATEPRD